MRRVLTGWRGRAVALGMWEVDVVTLLGHNRAFGRALGDSPARKEKRKCREVGIG